MRFEESIQILDLVDSGVILLDAHQNIVYWNEFVASTSQIDFEKAKGKHWLDVFPMLHKSRIENAVNKAINFNFPSILSYRLLKSSFPLYKKSLATKPPYKLKQSIVMKPLMENDENNGCIIYINDVSAAAKREEDLNHQTNELKEVIARYADIKGQFEQVFTNAHNGVLVFDQQGVIQKANDAALELFACQHDDMQDQNISQFLPDLKSRYYSEEKGGYVYEDDTPFEYDQEIKSQSKFVTVSLGCFANKTDFTFFVFLSDVTEQRVTEKKLLTANNELEEFAYRTSHDLRSPLVSSIKLMQVAANAIEKEDVNTVKVCIAHAERSLKKLEELIQSILDLTEVKNKPEEREVINVHELVMESLSSINQIDGFDKVRCTTRIAHQGELISQKTRFNMIVENLLSNAIKYLDPAEDEPFVEVSTHNEPGYFLLDVKDNGLGIPEEQRHKLFHMFHRFHPKVAFGSGLGLYLIKQSAEALGGSIAVHDTQAKGTCFRLKIPHETPLH